MKTQIPAGNKNVHMILFTILLGVVLLAKLISGYSTEADVKVIHVCESDGESPIKNVRVSILANAKTI